MFSSNYLATVDIKNEDAAKFYNNGENLAILRSGINLSIEKRPELTAADTVYLNMTGMQLNTNYQFQINPYNLQNGGLKGYLIDNYLHTKTLLDLNIEDIVSFTIDTSISSKSADRFYIVFAPLNALAINDVKLKAVLTNNNKMVAVQWIVVSEKDIASYDIEKSFDGIHFTTVSTSKANGTNNFAFYNWTDTNVVAGNIYYRIKVDSKDGEISYSNISEVMVDNSFKESIVVFPNPVKNNRFNLQFNNIKTGNYCLNLYDLNGKIIMYKEIVIFENTRNIPVKLKNTLPSGIYTIVVDSNNKQYKTNLIIQ